MIYYTIIDLCGGEYGVLLNIKRHSDRRGGCVALPRGVMGLSVVCDYGIS